MGVGEGRREGEAGRVGESESASTNDDGDTVLPRGDTRRVHTTCAAHRAFEGKKPPAQTEINKTTQHAL